MPHKHNDRDGHRQERDRYLKWDTVARLVDAAVSLLSMLLRK